MQVHMRTVLRAALTHCMLHSYHKIVNPMHSRNLDLLSITAGIVTVQHVKGLFLCGRKHALPKMVTRWG